MRVAFISGEIGDHAVSYFLESYLRHYTRGNVELTLYSTLWRPDGTKNELIELVDRQRDLFGLGDNDARAQIIADGIDILIDTTSHMAGNRLGMLSQRCAPIQCHYIGFHGTTGIGAIDYFIGDDEITPPEFASHFSETIVRLPRLWVAYTPRSDLPETEQNSSADEICFGCFNNLMKVREETLDIWGEVLLSVPNAKLILKDRRCADAYTRERIVGFLETRGITKERIEFIGQVSSWREHMRLYNRIDIALDTSPLNSGTTGFDALIMGTPLVALRGNWMGGRMSSSMLKSLGRPEWIASDRQDFTKIILKLVSDRQQLKRRKSALRSEVLNSQLCDGKSLAAALEQAFTRMIGDFNAQALPIGS